MVESEQAELYPTGTFLDEPEKLISPDASILAALGAFDSYMEEEGFSVNTRKAFLSDIRILGQYLGGGQAVGEIGTKNLNDFLNWLRHGRGVPCSNKTYARRITTLKTFFGWLHESGVIFFNPADKVIQVPVSSPLPEVPTRIDLDKALAVTSAIRMGSTEKNPDARPHLLLTLLLETGIKKGETIALATNHVDRSDPAAPYIFIRYSNPGLRQKERKIPLSSEWLDTLDEYLEQYDPGNILFNCTARNLEYILSNVGEEVGLPQGRLSFENLRWASAIRDMEREVEANQIRYKLGISPVTWRVTQSKLERLIEKQKRPV